MQQLDGVIHVHIVFIERRHADQHRSYDRVMYRQEHKSTSHGLFAGIDRKCLVRQFGTIRKNSSDNVAGQVIFKQVLVTADKRQEVTAGGKAVVRRKLFNS